MKEMKLRKLLLTLLILMLSTGVLFACSAEDSESEDAETNETEEQETVDEEQEEEDQE